MKKLLSLLTLLLGISSGAWAEDVTIFSANPTAAWSVPASTTDAEITSSYATISGGKMYVTNGQTSAKDLIKKQGEMAFQCTNNNTFFKVELNSALQAGDVISARMQSRTDADLGLWFSTSNERPAAEPTSKIVLATASSQTWVSAPSYTVAAGDGICGETTFYIYRHTGKSTYFNTFAITRETAATIPSAPTFSPANGDIEGTSTVAISGEGTIYYQLTSSATAPEIPTTLPGDWTEGKSVTMPNEDTTLYLHAFASNAAGNSAITTATFNVSVLSTFTYGITQDDLTTSPGLATTTNYTGNEVNLTMSNAAHGSSSSTRSVTNGTTTVTAAATACQRNTLCSGASDFVEASYYGFTLTIAKGYKMNVSQFFGDLYYDNSRSGKYKFAVYSGDTKVWEAGSSDYVTTGGGKKSTKTLDVSSVEALQGLTGTVQMRMVWYQNGSSSYVALKDFNIKGKLEVDERVTYDLTATAAPVDGGTITMDPVGGSYEKDTKVTLTAIANDGYYFVNWTNSSNEEVATTAAYEYTMGSEAAAFTANFAKYPVISFAIGESGATGTVPAPAHTTDGTYTTPSNNSLYVAGKTLTKWNDGTNDYAVGAAISGINADITLTPVFEDNAFSVKNIAAETTVNFPFVQANGAPVMAAEGNSTMMVAQATVSSQFIDVLMNVDASNGKFNNNQGNKSSCQINATTSIILPAAPGMTVTLDKEFSTSYLGEQSNTGKKANGSTTWTYNGTDAEVTLTIDESNKYPNKMTVVYPALPATTTVTISHVSGYRTFASKYPTDWSNVEGVTAYTATVSENTVIFAKVQGAVPAGTGLLLKGTASETPYTVDIPSEIPDAVNNALVGVTKDTPIGEGAFVLMDGSKGVGFYKTSANGFTVGANTAYLPADVVAGARTFIALDGDEATGINDNKRETMTNDRCYNLQGRRVSESGIQNSELKQGLYIMNGKKVLVK